MTATVGASTGVAANARKGRPRDERIDEDISSAALQVLAEGGFDRFSVEAVAQLAGVAKTTVYRRFPSREELVVAALERLNDDLPSAPREGSVRSQLIEVLDAIRRRTPDSVKGRILMHAVGEGAREPALAALVHDRVLAPRRQLIRVVIENGIASGELRADLDPNVVIPLLVGPMLYLGMWRMCANVNSVSVEDAVDLLMTGLTRANGS